MVPTAYIKKIQKTVDSGFILDITLLPENYLSELLYTKSLSDFRSAYLDAIIQGDILYDKEDILDSYKDLANAFFKTTSATPTNPAFLLQTISLAGKITQEIRYKEKSLGQFLLVSLLLDKLIDIEIMINLDRPVVSRKHKSALLKEINPALYKRFELCAFQADRPDYIQAFSAFSSELLAGYSSLLQNENLYEQSYITNGKIIVDIASEHVLQSLIEAIRKTASEKKLKNFRIYYLLTPFKLTRELSNKLVIRGRHLDLFATLIKAASKNDDAVRPAQFQLINTLFGGDIMLNHVEDLLSRLCRVFTSSDISGFNCFAAATTLIIAFARESSHNKKDFTSFSIYLLDSWICLSYDKGYRTYMELSTEKERTLHLFQSLLKSNEKLSAYIKTVLRNYTALPSGLEIKLAKEIGWFVKSKKFDSNDFTIPAFEVKKMKHYTKKLTQRKRWYIYRKTLELLFFNLKINETDFALSAFMVNKNIS